MFVATSSDLTCSDPDVVAAYSKKLLMNNLEKGYKCMFTALVVSYANAEISLSPRDALDPRESPDVRIPLTYETRDKSVETRKSTGSVEQCCVFDFILFRSFMQRVLFYF